MSQPIRLLSLALWRRKRFLCDVHDATRQACEGLVVRSPESLANKFGITVDEQNVFGRPASECLTIQLHMSDMSSGLLSNPQTFF